MSPLCCSSVQFLSNSEHQKRHSCQNKKQFAGTNGQDNLTEVITANASVHVTRSAAKVAVIATAAAIAPDLIILVILGKIPFQNHPQEVHLPPHR
jgi:hypothetical protein